MRIHQAIVGLLVSISMLGAQGADSTTKPQPRGEQWFKRHAHLNRQASGSRWQLVFIGDSITDGWQGEAVRDVWQQHYGDRHAGNLGIGGDQTQHVIYRIENGNLDGQSPKLAVIMIGTNNLGGNRFEPPATIEGVSAVVGSVRKETPETKILLLGIFPRGEARDDPYRVKIRDVNQALSKLADWQKIHYLNIGQVFLEADGSISKEIMPDFLHLSKEGYRRWAEAIEPKVAELLDEPDELRHVLFDGSSLDGWSNEDGEGPPSGWGVVDGTLAVTGWGEDAFTDQEFGDFDFQVEWKIPRKGNSGIFYRVADYRYIWLGPEYQLVDDLTRRYRADANNSTGASIDLYGPSLGKPVREHSQWNHTRIRLVDNHAEHWLNGELILEYDIDSEDWHARVKESKFARLHPYFGKPKRGKFKLENHIGSRVQYRDLMAIDL